MNYFRPTNRLIILFFILVCYSVSTYSQTKGSTDCEAMQQQAEANKEMVVKFYQQLFGDKDLSAIDKHIAEDYIQHNPMAADGREALKKFARQFLEGQPKDSVDFQRVVAEGDLVWLHIRSIMGGKTYAIVDIFRIEDGMIQEHWDVIQEVPEKSANDHPMF